MDLGELIYKSIEAGNLETLIWAYQRITTSLTYLWIYGMAAENGHLHILKWLLTLPEKDTIIEDISYDGTVFLEASKHDNLHICRWLISLPDKFRVYIHLEDLFIKEGKLEVCKMFSNRISLKEDLAEIRYDNEDGHLFSPLSGGHLDVCRWLLSLPEECDVYVMGLNYNTFELALSKGYYDICELIFKHPSAYSLAKECTHRDYLLDIVLREEYYALFEKLSKDYRIESKEMTYRSLLFYARREHDWGLCRWLLEEHRDKL